MGVIWFVGGEMHEAIYNFVFNAFAGVVCVSLLISVFLAMLGLYKTWSVINECGKSI